MRVGYTVRHSKTGYPASIGGTPTSYYQAMENLEEYLKISSCGYSFGIYRTLIDDDGETIYSLTLETVKENICTDKSG